MSLPFQTALACLLPMDVLRTISSLVSCRSWLLRLNQFAKCGNSNAFIFWCMIYDVWFTHPSPSLEGRIFLRNTLRPYWIRRKKGGCFFMRWMRTLPKRRRCCNRWLRFSTTFINKRGLFFVIISAKKTYSHEKSSIRGKQYRGTVFELLVMRFLLCGCRKSAYGSGGFH